MRYQGSCHCGAIKFEIEAAKDLEVEECNCSICAKSGYLHLILPKTKFTLLQGEESITTYTFNTGIAKHMFCKVCGVKPFYTPRSNPDGYAVNARCLDTNPESLSIVQFDGINWEQNAHKLAHKSKQA
ncbi:MAG: GFA family protein [Pseudomonadales bacterium]